MTVERLQTALDKIDEFYRLHLTDAERKARTEVYAYTLKDIPDEVAMQALMRAFTGCRYPSQLLVDWCAEIRKTQAAALPSAEELWQQALAVAREIDQNLYWARSGGLVTASGKLTPSDIMEHVKTVFDGLPAAVRAWAGGPQDLVSLMGRSYADLSQYIKPGFVRAVETAQPDARLPALSPASPCQDAPRVDRAQPSGNDFLADAATRPRRHKRKG